MRLLDPGFRYVPAAHTNVTATWKRFGYRPTTDAERRARQGRLSGAASGEERTQAAVRSVRRRGLPPSGEAGPARLRLAVSE